MKKCIRYFLVFLIVLHSIGALAQSPGKEFTQNEKEYYKLFHGFINHLNERQIKEKGVAFTDSSGVAGSERRLDSALLASKRRDSLELNYLTGHYLFPGMLQLSSAMDSGTIKGLREAYFQTVRAAIRHFEDFIFYLEPGKINELECMPIRLFPEKSIYDQLKPYQKENIIVYFFRSKPLEPLGYMLMAPPSLIYKGSKPMIFAWDFCIGYGKYYFRCLNGNVEEGFFYEGVKGPEHPIEL